MCLFKLPEMSCWEGLKIESLYYYLSVYVYLIFAFTLLFGFYSVMSLFLEVEDSLEKEMFQLLGFILPPQFKCVNQIKNKHVKVWSLTLVPLNGILQQESTRKSWRNMLMTHTFQLSGLTMVPGFSRQLCRSQRWSWWSFQHPWIQQTAQERTEQTVLESKRR